MKYTLNLELNDVLLFHCSSRVFDSRTPPVFSTLGLKLRGVTYLGSKFDLDLSDGPFTSSRVSVCAACTLTRLQTPHVNPGPLYRCSRGTFKSSLLAHGRRKGGPGTQTPFSVLVCGSFHS